jgi:hypothetical protein
MPKLHQITHYVRNKCLTPKLLYDKTHAQFPNIKSWTLVLRFIMLVLKIYHQQIHMTHIYLIPIHLVLHPTHFPYWPTSPPRPRVL